MKEEFPAESTQNSIDHRLSTIDQLKTTLYKYCQDYVEQRVTNARNAMEAAQKAANEESKSSVGDKFETTRAMMQGERDRHAMQLGEALKLKQQLANISPDKSSDRVGAGSLVLCNTANYYIGVSAGKVVLKGKTYYCISVLAPIAKALLGKKAEEEAFFNSKSIKIVDVY